MITLSDSPSTTSTADLLQQVLAEHLDPRWGSAYWLHRARQTGIHQPREIDSLQKLVAVFQQTPADLQRYPLMDYIPRRFHATKHQLILGQTGGTTGQGTWTAYTPDEFHLAFVEPFLVAAGDACFPKGLNWLFAGPSGPHIISKAASAITRGMNSPEPFALDLDPRWARKMPAQSIGAQRYLQHVIDQALAIIHTQNIGVLFATPPILLALAKQMTITQRSDIVGVHYGGMAISPQTRQFLEREAFPQAVHLSGYGNSLLGCCMELPESGAAAMDYFPFGQRLILEVVDDHQQPTSTGQLRVTRLDPSFMIVGLLERDHGQLIQPPSSSPVGFTAAGVRQPHTPLPTKNEAVATLY